MNSGKKWIFIGLCLVFISGLFAGIVVERKFLNCHAGPKEQRREKFQKKDALDRLTKDLSLNSEQRAAIDRIFDKHKPEFEALHKQVRVNITQIMDEMDKEILSTLNNQQKMKYENFIKERNKHHPKD
jgi:hypothetical protein